MESHCAQFSTDSCPWPEVGATDLHIPHLCHGCAVDLRYCDSSDHGAVGDQTHPEGEGRGQVKLGQFLCNFKMIDRYILTF